MQVLVYIAAKDTVPRWLIFRLEFSAEWVTGRLQKPGWFEVKLKSFSGQGVHGYLRPNVVFNEDLTILVGVNGSGKTTVLRLIHAILTPSISDLVEIEFKELRLEVDDRGRLTVISVVKEGGNVVLGVSGEDSQLTIPLIEPSASGLRRVTVLEEREHIYEHLRSTSISHPVWKAISALRSPLFLGLERKHNFPEDPDVPARLDRGVGPRSARLRSPVFSGALGDSLADVQALLNLAYRRMRESQEGYVEKLRKSILLSSFRYTEFAFESHFQSSRLEQRSLIDRREEIRQALRNLGIAGNDVNRQLDDFFDRLEGLFNLPVGDEGSPSINIEWLTNKAQIDRVEELLRLIDDHKSRLDKIFSPVARFVDVVNSFFIDSRKSIDVDPIGTMSVLRPDKQRAPISALSSGERQLLVIFGHLFFSKFGARSQIFIVDEPELSLHLGWQERFVSQALEANASAQLVLATHSPEIVGEFEGNCVSV